MYNARYLILKETSYWIQKTNETLNIPINVILITAYLNIRCNFIHIMEHSFINQKLIEQRATNVTALN